MPEIKRKNGYYYHKKRYLPSVSTILKSAGNNESLNRWACEQGGLGVIWGLAKHQGNLDLMNRLGSSSCIAWAAEQALVGLESEGRRVKDFGTLVHNGIEAFLLGKGFESSDLTDNMKTSISTFKDFYEEVGFKPLFVEDSVYSEEHKYAGRTDWVFDLTEEMIPSITPYLTKTSSVLKPGLIMSDFKTGNLYPKSQSVQLAAYAQAHKETHDQTCNGGLIINIPREEPTKIKCHFFDEIDLHNAFWNGFVPAKNVWEFFDAPQWYHKQNLN